MTTDDRFSRTLESWLHEEAEHRVPDHLAEVLVQTVAARQRPWWSSPERWLPMDLTTRARTLPAPRLGRLVLVAALLLALAAAAALIAGSRQRVPPPFGVARNGPMTTESGGDVYLIDADGSHQRPLLTGAENDFGAGFSRDGTRLLFLRGSSQGTTPMVADQDGTGARPLTSAPMTGLDWYEWSPTGDRVVLVHTVAGKRVLSIVDTDDPSSLRDLPLPGVQVDYDVLWRPPDGDELIFSARPDPNAGAGVGLYRIHPDGTGFATVAPAGPDGLEYTYNNPEISPDGRFVTFWQYDHDTSSDGFGSSIHLVDLDSLDEQVLRFGPDTVDEGELHFSPDGTQGVMIRCPGDVCRPAIVALDGSRSYRFIGPTVPGDGANRLVGFSPDGRQVVVHQDGEKPVFIDIATGQAHEGGTTIARFGSWQRLAP